MMAYVRIKPEGGHKKGACDRWCTRAEAKKASRKARRVADWKACAGEDRNEPVEKR